MSDERSPTGLIIPWQKLSKEALGSLIEEFILREGTDYGVREYSLEEKRNQVFNQLKNGHIAIVFDSELESTTLMKREDITKSGLQNL